MKRKTVRSHRSLRRVDLQVSIFMAFIVLITTLSTFGLSYHITYCDMIYTLRERVSAIYSLLDTELDKTTFTEINSAQDMDKPSYQETKELLYFLRNSTGVMYLYTAKQNAHGELVYVVDGLSEEEDFRYPGDLIEPEIVEAMDKALAGVTVWPDAIQNTEWGKIFITYLPIHNADGSVAGVVGIEFPAEHQYNTYRTLRFAAPLCILLVCVICVAFAILFFRRISNPTYQDLINTDQLTSLKSRNAFEVDLHNYISSRVSKGVCLMVADLDYLKKVNDTLGHEQGDAYIQRAAKAMQQAMGQHAALYRIGGDEFIAIFSPATPALVQENEQALLRCFEALKPDWPIPTSLSIGSAIFDATQDTDLHDTYRRADKQMYETKRQTHHSREQT